MLYKLLIVDDEEMIREGLSSIVEWDRLGFEVAKCLADGREAIEYINNHEIDVILTDIKMTFVSGLQLAEYVYRNKPGIKVVIISGYKDFDFAKQAISFNVVHYILKPTRLLELNQVFQEIKSQLQKEREEKERLAEERQQYTDLIPMLQEEFLSALMMGVLKDKAEIRKKIHLLNFGRDFDQKRCYLLKARFCDFEKYLEDIWAYGKAGFYNAIRNMFKEDADLYYHTVNCGHGRILVLAVERGEAGRLLPDRELLRNKFENVGKTIDKVFGIALKIETVKAFENIYAVDEKGFEDYFFSDADMISKNMLDSKEFLAIYEKQKLLLSYITEGNKEAVGNLFDTLIDSMRGVDIATARNFFIELFSLLGSKLKSIDIDVYLANNEIFDYHQILKLKDISAIQELGRSILNIVVAYVGSQKENCDNKVIEKAKEYICSHYNKDITLDDVADHVYLSTVYLSRFFKQNTGENFIDFLGKVRVENAMVFLRNPRYKVYEIGPMVGYKSIKYFSNIFKRFTGMNPSEYRKNQVEESDLKNGR